MPPVIAITPCQEIHDYEASIQRAGGIPRVLTFAADPPATVLAQVDGVLLTGGGDVWPALYGEAADPTFDPAEAGRDEYELELVRRATEADVPVLAICRGLQVLNVARGGTLVQDIPTQQPGALVHEIGTPRTSPAHEIWVAPGSRLALLLDTDARITVNSRHHQAVKDLGRGLVSTATAPDGVIEAVEDATRRFCLAVQWHPENFYRTGEFRTLFEGLIGACTPR